MNCVHQQEKEAKIYGRLTKVYVCKKFGGSRCDDIFQKRCPYYKENIDGQGLDNSISKDTDS